MYVNPQTGQKPTRGGKKAPVQGQYLRIYDESAHGNLHEYGWRRNPNGPSDKKWTSADGNNWDRPTAENVGDVYLERTYDGNIGVDQAKMVMSDGEIAGKWSRKYDPVTDTTTFTQEYDGKELTSWQDKWANRPAVDAADMSGSGPRELDFTKIRDRGHDYLTSEDFKISVMAVMGSDGTTLLSDGMSSKIIGPDGGETFLPMGLGGFKSAIQQGENYGLMFGGLDKTTGVEMFRPLDRAVSGQEILNAVDKLIETKEAILKESTMQWGSEPLYIH